MTTNITFAKHRNIRKIAQILNSANFADVNMAIIIILFKTCNRTHCQHILFSNKGGENTFAIFAK